jgi:hypothetical protein
MWIFPNTAATLSLRFSTDSPLAFAPNRYHATINLLDGSVGSKLFFRCSAKVAPQVFA